MSCSTGKDTEKAPEPLPRRLQRPNWISARSCRAEVLNCGAIALLRDISHCWYSVENRQIVSLHCQNFSEPHHSSGTGTVARICGI